ncbi:MAG TPA: N-methyl-L-tryptophan oxidase [Candidatus Polarisedimenticolia bacterium]|nr:N-methyl-L-tryptophan oxidase [Candidatus Polarisedimenticolia bacterium]
MARTWDAIVVGLGGFGSAAAYWLARRVGSRVLGLERFELGHDRGASADHSRIIRLSYHRPDYIRLAQRAYATWADLAADTGSRVVTTTGGLDLFPPGAAIPEPDYTMSMLAEGVPFERLDAADAMRRFPAWQLDDGTSVLYQADAGIADPFRANEAHRRRARELGATLLDRTRVTGLREAGGEVDVITEDGTTHRAGHVVIAADAWTNQLLASFDRRLPLTITREQVTYFEAAQPDAFTPDRFPIWIWMDDPCFYGFPAYGEPGPKAAQDVGGAETTGDSRGFETNEPALARLTAFLDRHLPGMAARELLTKTCLYTLTPDRDFVVDRLPEAPNVTVLLGAAHGFKYASVLGRIAAELAIDGTTPSADDIAAFRIDRPILLETAPATSWLV